MMISNGCAESPLTESDPGDLAAMGILEEAKSFAKWRISTGSLSYSLFQQVSITALYKIR
jgi:hypothetical protein